MGVQRDPLTLLQGVHEVAAFADPAKPQAVSQRAFDRARAGSAAHASLPAASQIARELKLKWPVVLEVAFAPSNRRSNLLALKTQKKKAPDGWLTEARVKYVLRLVAGRLKTDGLTTIAYDLERTVLLTEDARDWLHGRRLRLPSALTIGRAMRGWDKALSLAGLKERPSQKYPTHQKVLTRLEVMDRFYECYGEQPSESALREFAAGNGLPMQGKGKQKWSETIAEWRQRRRDNGLPEPRVVDYRRSPAKRPDFSADLGAAKDGEYRVKGKWADENACLEWVTSYLNDLPDRTVPQASSYQAWVRQNPGAPSPSSFKQHGGWSAVLEQAQKRCKAQEAAQARTIQPSPPSQRTS